MMTLAFLLLMISAGWPAGQGSGKQPFTIDIASTGQTLDAGTGVAVQVSLKNTSTEPLDCSANISDQTGLDPNFLIDVRDAKGQAVPKIAYPHPELAGGHPILNCTIAPGQSWTETLPIFRVYDMSRPGRYEIQVSRPISFTDPRAGSVNSNIVAVTVVPAPFTLEISAPSTEVKAGAEIPLNIRVTNTSGSDLVLSPGAPGAAPDLHYMYACQDSAGKDVARAHKVSLEDRPSLTIRRGETFNQKVDIASACDLSKPGTFRVRVARYDPEGPQKGVVQSNEITLTAKP